MLARSKILSEIFRIMAEMCRIEILGMEILPIYISSFHLLPQYVPSLIVNRSRGL